MSIIRAGSRAANLLGGVARRSEAGSVRFMSGGHSVEQEIAECNKWRTITMIAVPICLMASAYALSLPHEHHGHPPEYSYLHVRSKSFPWGECGLFEKSCWDEKKAA